MSELDIYELGSVSFKEASRFQEIILEKRINNEINDSLILLEHPPTITTGRRGNSNNLIVDKSILHKKAITFEIISRGGDITFHGPGQIVGYPIFNLNNRGKDIHKYLRSLEKILILTLKEFKVDAETIDKLTGVWVKKFKIASIGIGVRRWTTYHGFALNVNTDLSYFDLIVPCGISDVRMTSIKELLNHTSKIDTTKVKKVIAKNFASVFNFTNTNLKRKKDFEKLLFNTK